MFNLLLYICLYSFAVYFSNYIYGKIVLSLLIIFIISLLSKKNITYIWCVFIVFLSFFNPYFIAFLYPYLPQEDFKNKVFINLILLRFAFENAYFLGTDSTLFLLHFWGIPLIIRAIYVPKLLKKYASSILYALSIASIIGLFGFNQKIQNSNHYTLANENAIVANHKMLSGYFSNIQKISLDDAISKENGYFIFPISENEELVKKNYIQQNNVYLLLAEHDNLNNFLEKYPYFNNDVYWRTTPWHLYQPNFILPLQYVIEKDIFYSSNLGATVKKGYPIVWEYSKFGRPIVMASLANIKDSKVFLWGDSDFFVSIIYFIFHNCFK